MVKYPQERCSPDRLFVVGETPFVEELKKLAFITRAKRLSMW
jgi:hypothetical protein